MSALTYFGAGFFGSLLGTWVGFRIALRAWDRDRERHRLHHVNPRTLGRIIAEDPAWKEVS